MNWITNYVRPRINSIFSRREVPENLWQKCDECGTMLFHRELSDNLNVCTNCDHHMAITPRARFEALFDGGVFTEVKVPEPVADPLKFRDQKKYPDRMKAAQKKTGEKEAMLVAAGEIGRTPIVAAAQDFSFLGGFLMVGLLVIVVASIANIFFQVPAASLAISAAAVFIMSGLILFDTSRIIHGGETNYIRATVALYLDIYNLFVHLLHLLGVFSGDD